MVKKLTTLLGICAIGGVCIYSVPTQPTMQPTAKSDSYTKTAKGETIKLSPSNKLNFARAEERAIQASPFGISSSRRKHNAPARIAAAQNVADSIVLYGLNYVDGTWQTMSPLGSNVFSFHAAPTSNFLKASEEMERPMAAFYAKGRFHLLFSTRVEDENYNSFCSVHMKVYDADSWKEIETVTIADNVEGWDYFLRQVAAYDPLTDKTYTMSWGDGKPLISIDMNNYETKIIGGNANKFVQTMFVDDKGQLFGITFDDKKLYKIDKANGEMAEVGEIDIPFGISTDPMSAVFNPVTQKAYWVAVNGDNKESVLFTLDPYTAHAEKVADMPDNEHILGLYMPETNASAPSAPTKINFKDGTLTFKAPSVTYTSKENLSGILTARVAENGKTLKTVNVNPGQDASINLDLEDGEHHLVLSIENRVGKSQERRLDTYIGNDVPCAVNNLRLSMENTKNAVLTWDAPDKSVHGAAINDNTLNYTVIRWPDEVIVAEGLTTTSFTEPIPEAHARYYYEVIAFSGNLEGEHTVSNTVTGGAIWLPPYIETFETQDDFDTFKIIDANNDLNTWSFLLPVNSTNGGYAYLHGNGTPDVDTGIYEGNGNDDYLISPSIKLKAGVDYRISFETYNNWSSYEHLTIYLGKEHNRTGNETQIFTSDKIEPNSSYSFLFNVPKDGLYNLLFHGDNPGPSVNLLLDNISIDEYATLNGPGCVTDLKVTAGASGALENTLQFTAPTSTYKGETLSSIDRVEIYRNNGRKPAKVFDKVSPGDKITWLDTGVEQGMVNYKILVFNDKGQGQEALASVWTGLDQPALVSNAKIRMNDEYKAVASFEKVGSTGMHGGYVDPSEVKYALYRYNEYSWDMPWEQVTEFADITEITDNSYSGWGQAWVDYAVVASNSAGLSDGRTLGIVLGEPYARPYNESFAYGFANMGPWTLIAESYDYAWNMVTGSRLRTKPYDNDEGMLQFSYKAPDSNSQVIVGPRTSLEGSANPQLSFFMNHGFEAETEDLLLDVYLNYDDTGWDKTATIPYNNGSAGWERYAIPLKKNAGNVQIAFGGYAADASAPIYIDAIEIAEGNDTDMAVKEISVSSKRINAGEKATVNVAIANYGIKNAENVDVILSDNGNELMKHTVAQIKPNDVTNVSFEIATTRKDASRRFSLTATTKIAGDNNTDNNTSNPVGVYVKGSILPKATSLAGKKEGSDIVLSWEKPKTCEINDAVTDDFDSYESFIIDGIGDWMTYDGDGAPTVYFGGPEIPNVFLPKAWQIWAPEEAGFSLEKFDMLTPHSGDKYLACWAASDGNSATLPNDDWFISPEVTGGTDVSFWYRMPNDGSDPQLFEMLYSSTDREPESFTAFDSDGITFGTNWVYFEFTLPEDARYFAIRSCSSGSYTVALLDDITYTPLYSSTTSLNLAGYNIYRDDELISNVTDTSYIDKDAGSTKHIYNVTAVYKEGESNYSNDFNSDTNSVMKPSTAGYPVVRTHHNMIEVLNAEGLETTIASSQGIILFNGIADGMLRISADPGIYMVNINGSRFKAIVK